MTHDRSFLKWAGGKYNCLNRIVSTLVPGRRLIEPFAGSGVVFLNCDYASYLLAEANKDLIHIFTLLQKDTAFINYCRRYFHAHTNKESLYYQYRSEFNSLNYTKKRAALFLYLNRHGYNGLCRYNSKGIFNVPFGRYVKPYFPQKEMLLFHQKSQNAVFLQNDFRKTFELAERGDVIYCDPPYVPISEATKPVPYTQKQFSLTDQIELAELARETAAKGIPVILSNHDTPFTRKHYKKAELIHFHVPRFINCKSNNRNPVMELIAVFQ